MALFSRLVAAGVGLVVVPTLAACGSSGSSGSSAPTASAPAYSASHPGASEVGGPARRAADDRQVVGSADGIDVTITPQGRATIRPGGAPLRFTVTLVNTTTTDYAQVGLVVSLGHCSCDPAGSRMMAAGTMSMFDAGTNAWLTVPYVAEGTGTDFLSRTIVPAFPLTHGQAVTYRLQLRLDANQAFPVGDGTSSIDATMTSVATNAAAGPSPTTSLPITVKP